METGFQSHSSRIKQLNNEELLSRTKLMVQKERNTHIQILHHLAEIDSRKLYFKQGFSSLFDYAVRELDYSEGAAYRRIKAMKLCRDLPETESRLQSGRLSLSAASQLQVFFEKQDKKIKEEEKKALPLKSTEQRVSESEIQKQESEETQKLKQKPTGEVLKKSGQNSQSCSEVFDKKVSQNEEFKENSESHRSLSQEEKENLIKRAEGCSTRATAKLLSETDPSLSLFRDRTRFLGKGKIEIKMVIDEECHKKLEKLKNLLSHKNPNLSYGELLAILSKEALKKYDPQRKNTCQKKEEQVQEKPSIKKQELKDKTANPEATFAPKLRQKKGVSEQLEPLFGKSSSPTKKPLISMKKSLSPTRKKQHKQMISRYIHSYLRKYIWKRDEGQCTYVHHETKRRCTSRHLLQIDHIQPFALGGKTEKENLRLLCAGHNQYRR